MSVGSLLRHVIFRIKRRFNEIFQKKKVKMSSKVDEKITFCKQVNLINGGVKGILW